MSHITSFTRPLAPARWSALLVGLVLAFAALSPQAAQAQYVPSQFFGQHLMWEWTLTPAFPVHSMRLWTSNTDWCEMDNGTSSGQYNFGQLDALLGQASNLGADVEFTIGTTPTWAATGAYPQASVVDQCDWGGKGAEPPANDSYWTNFITALVTHAKGRIKAYELWNEVDYPPSWSGSVAQMVRMSVEAAAIIHSIDPSALVLSPSITATPEGYTWLQQYLSGLPPGTIDGIAVHSYTAGAWPEQYLPREMSAVRAALPPAYANLPIWSTEGGWGLNSQFSSKGSDQAAFVARYDLMMLNQGVARSYWYAYENTQYGTLWDGTQLTPAGVASATIENWLSGGTFSGCSTSDGNFWTCNLTTASGNQAQIVWATQSAVWYPTTGYNTVDTLDGGSSAATGWIQVGSDPIMLVQSPSTTTPPATTPTTPTPSTTTPPTAPPTIPTPPSFTGVSQSHRRWRLGGKLSRFAAAAKTPVGTTFGFTLNETATVRFAFAQLLPGRKAVNGKCVAQTAANRRRSACTRSVPRGSLSFSAGAGLHKLSFQGRLTRTRKLRPGSYAPTITATNDAGQVATKTLRPFTIVPG